MPSSDFVDDVHDPYYEDTDQEHDIYNTSLEYHDWMTWYGHDLMNMWMGVKMYLRDSYLEKPLMGPMDYDDFCGFFYEFSSQMSSRRAT
jgi:hypothetical protein